MARPRRVPGKAMPCTRSMPTYMLIYANKTGHSPAKTIMCAAARNAPRSAKTRALSGQPAFRRQKGCTQARAHTHTQVNARSAHLCTCGHSCGRRGWTRQRSTEKHRQADRADMYGNDAVAMRATCVCAPKRPISGETFPREELPCSPPSCPGRQAGASHPHNQPGAPEGRPRLRAGQQNHGRDTH